MASRRVHGLAGVVFCLIFLPKIKGDLQLIGPPEAVVGIVGHDRVLPCRLDPAQSVAENTVEWTRPDLSPFYVHILSYGKLLLDQQNPSFRQRTNLSESELKNGNLSLTLYKVRLSDEGTYMCKYVTKGSASPLQVPVRLVVVAVSQPTISLKRFDEKLLLKGEAKNWIPVPEMEWRDKQGSIIPHEDMNSESDSAVSQIEVDIGASDFYTLTVRLKNISRVANFTVPAEYLEIASHKVSWSRLITVVAILGLVLSAVVLGTIMYNWETVRDRCQRLRTRLGAAEAVQQGGGEGDLLMGTQPEPQPGPGPGPGVVAVQLHELPGANGAAAAVQPGGGEDEADAANLHEEVQRLQTDNQNLSEEVQRLQTDNQNLSEEVQRLQTDNQNLSEEVQRLQTDNQNLSEEVQRLTKQIKDLEKKS